MTAMKATIPDSSKEPGDPRASAAALAAYTDALLAGQTPDPQLTPELGSTVHRLAQALPPAATPAELQQRVLRQVRLEWQKEAPAPLGTRLTAVWRNLKRSLARRPAWAAMATLIIVGTLVALLTQGTAEVAGTATGISPVGWLAFLAVGLLLAGAVLWWSKRR